MKIKKYSLIFQIAHEFNLQFQNSQFPGPVISIRFGVNNVKMA